MTDELVKRLTPLQVNAISYLYGGDRDVTIECWSVKWVVTRYSHHCVSIYHKGKPCAIPAGSRVIVERAKVDGQFGSCYTCSSCLERAIMELRHD